MTFSNYGRPIPHGPVMECRMQALSDAFAEHGGAQLDTLMGTGDHRYREDVDTGTVVLSLTPSARMTWRDWRAGLMGVGFFVGSYETVEFIFSMRRLGEQPVIGLGYLAYRGFEVEGA